MDISLYPARRFPADLAGAWAELQRSEAGLNHPLLHPTWTELAAAVRDNVEVAVLRQGGEAVGFFAFERAAPCRGQAVAASMSDLHGLVARRQTDCDPAELLRACRLSTWHFDHVPVEQPWFAPYHGCVEEAPAIDLHEGYEAWWLGRRGASPAWAAQLERKRRKLAREVGPLRFEWRQPDRTVLAKLVEWKRRQLQQSRSPDVFGWPWFARLLELVCERQSEGFCGVLSALYAGSELVAVHAGMHNRRVLVAWIPTYNAAYARYSPGALLHLELAQAAAARGIQRIELGRGINPLKRALGSSADRLAIGAVDLRPGRRWCRARWLQLRGLAHTSPLGNLPLRVYRRMRSWAASHSLASR